MSIDCGDCNSFLDYTQRYYQSIFTRYGFTLLRCSSDYDGRECLLMYQSEQCRLLFFLSDGAEGCAIGPLDAPFPDNTRLYTNGEIGWYYIVPLIEFKSGKKLLTRRLLDEFLDGKRIYFEWESRLMSDWADVLMDMFAPGKQQTWHDDFVRYVQTRQYG